MLSNVYTATLDDTTTYLQGNCSDFESVTVIVDGTWDGELGFYATIDEVSYPGAGLQDGQNGSWLQVVNPEGSSRNALYYGSVRGLTGFGAYTANWVSGNVSVQIVFQRAAK